eukprot:3494961-Rhodomonas_salina.5
MSSGHHLEIFSSGTICYVTAGHQGIARVQADDQEGFTAHRNPNYYLDISDRSWRRSERCERLWEWPERTGLKLNLKL